jgi:ketosteroid isomerase-like protein
MKRLLSLAFISSLFFACTNSKPADTAATTSDSAVAAAPAKPQPTEFADSKYADIGKKGFDALSSGDIDAWMSTYADNAVYIWNNGDSIAGKAAITAYWKKRRTEVIDSIKFLYPIWLPIKVNEPQQPVQAPGVWLLSWHLTSAKYKTGKRMTQWMHTVMHFDANDKIDRVLQFLDRVPINAATKK